MQGAEFSAIGSPLNYKFQEQELQETGFYSFKWRNYDPSMGRFFNVDPLSEKYAYQSHYNFSENRMLDGRELEGLERVGHDWSGYDFKGDPDSQRNSAIQNHKDKVNEIEGVTVYSYTPLEDKSAGISLPDINIDWEAVGDFAIDMTPVGDVRDMYEGVRDGDYLKAAMGATSLGMTFVAPGSGSLLKLAGKSLLKRGAKELAREVAEEAMEYATKEESATLYRNFGWNELNSIKNSGGQFSIHPNQFQGKQFWVGESGMNMWTNSSFAKPFTAKVTIPKSFVTPGHKNYIFMESNMIIDGFPGGTVLPNNMQKFNSAIKIDWVRY